MEGQGFPLQDKDRIAGNVSDHSFYQIQGSGNSVSLTGQLLISLYKGFSLLGSGSKLLLVGHPRAVSHCQLPRRHGALLQAGLQGWASAILELHSCSLRFSLLPNSTCQTDFQKCNQVRAQLCGVLGKAVNLKRNLKYWVCDSVVEHLSNGYMHKGSQFQPQYFRREKSNEYDDNLVPALSLGF